MEWTVEFLNQAVEGELLALPKNMQARFLRVVDLLVRFGPQEVGMPYVRPLRDKLSEMRLSGEAGIARALYVAAPGRRLVVLHVFVKKTEKTPRRAIELALARMKEINP